MMKLFKLFQKLKSEPSKLAAVPKHLAIIMDGNGRWAKERSLPRTLGHRAGMERIRDAITVCLDYGVAYLTLYAFSTENWARPAEEVGFLMNLFEEALKKEIDALHQKDVKVRFIGLKNNLSPSLLELMEQSEKKTENNQALVLNLAINYGGRAEIVSAVRGIARAVQRGEFDPDNLDESAISERVFTAGQPDPDLLIRPGKESRISNFLIWQAAYAEFYFSDKYWPEFGRNELIAAFAYYSRKERRFGGIKRGESV